MDTGGYCESDARLLFALADATWRSEVVKVLQSRVDEANLAERPEARGEPGTLLHAAYEARERAYRRWRGFEDET